MVGGIKELASNLTQFGQSSRSFVHAWMGSANGRCRRGRKVASEVCAEAAYATAARRSTKNRARSHVTFFFPFRFRLFFFSLFLFFFFLLLPSANVLPISNVHSLVVGTYLWMRSCLLRPRLKMAFNRESQRKSPFVRRGGLW